MVRTRGRAPTADDPEEDEANEAPDDVNPEDEDEQEEEDEEEEEEDEDDEDEEEVEETGALTPGVSSRGVFDYANNKAHYYVYRNATAKLEEELYDCVPEQFFPFMTSLEERANAYGWDDDNHGILWVNKRDQTMVNLLDNYGSVTLKEVRRHEKTYWDTGNRKSQDDRMLYECLMASLSKDGKTAVSIHSDDYHLPSYNPATGRYRKIPSGLCLLKVVVRESYLDSNATTSMIREQLSNLDLHMPQANNDITRFNNHVKLLLKALNARGERTLDLLTYLFKAYAVCNDKVFTKYIEDLQTSHDMGTNELTAQTLMQYAEKKFKIMKTLKKWEAPTQIDEEIMAMQVKMDRMQDKLNNVKKDGKRKADDRVKPTKPKKEGYKEKPKWLKENIPPEMDEIKKPKMWNSHPWYWCGHETGGHCGGHWRRHKPKECKSTPGKKLSDKKDYKNKKPRYGKTPDISIKAVTMSDDSDDDGNNEEMEGGYETE